MGGPRGCPGRSGVSRRSWGGVEGSRGGSNWVSGRFLRGLGGIGQSHFLFVGGLCQWSTEIFMFSVLSDFVRRSVVSALCSFLLFLEACFLRNSEVKML